MPLSYRHAFHAGNHADVLKHAVLTLCVEYLLRENEPFFYIDTHAGIGRYDLRSEWAQKHREFDSGVLPLWKRSDLPPELHSYIDIVRQMNSATELRWYPGSPWLFRQRMRKRDKARLFELHSDEFMILQNLFANEKNIKVHNSDGLKALKTLLPPLDHRALVLIDPAYEIQNDFNLAVSSLIEAYRRFTSGIYLLWYPHIQRSDTVGLENGLRASGIKNMMLAELTVSHGPGMGGSGMIVINPPWSLEAELQNVLPFLAGLLGSEGKGEYRLDMLASKQKLDETW